MSNEMIKELFKQADSELYNARNELYKPAEDVVNYSVCVFARSALYRFIQCLYMIYTDQNGDTPEQELTMEQMMDYINRYDSNAMDIDFSNVHCKSKADVTETKENLYFCNSVDHVKYCTDTADRVRDLVIEKAWGPLTAD
ncbi:hypothetical protein [Rhodohalobacter sp.]|uniref:hypothetical protein n=1 Tax=Rhodohalobacter sp. TaxID=1974210 RepID=UPI003568D141